MAVYLRSLTATAVVTMIMIHLSPQGFEKHMKYLASLIAAVIMLSPLQGIFTDAKHLLDEFYGEVQKITVPENEFMDGTNRVVLQTSAENICRNLRDLLSERYKTKGENLQISMLLDVADPSSVKIKEITVTLFHEAKLLDCNAIQAYVADLFSCQTTVVYGEERSMNSYG